MCAEIFFFSKRIIEGLGASKYGTVDNNLTKDYRGNIIGGR